MYKVIDLFSGIGGLSLGFRMEGFEISIANEIDESIADSYKKNHPGDVYKRQYGKTAMCCLCTRVRLD